MAKYNPFNYHNSHKIAASSLLQWLTKMKDSSGSKRLIIERTRLPVHFPTHRHSAQFWEQLGRTIATFGFFEEVLGKAIFAFTATRRYGSVAEAEVAYQVWLPQLQRALTDSLSNLADSYGMAVRANPDSTIKNVDELVKDIKTATNIRNVLCHGSWVYLIKMENHCPCLSITRTRSSKSPST